VTALVERTKKPAKVRVRLATPVRLRIWVLSLVVTAVALLVTASVLMSRVQNQVRIIGDEAAPQAATASDLYLALSDLDAQTARLVLVDKAPALAGTQIDALSTYQQRSRQIDADLARALTTSATADDRRLVQQLMTGLAIYRHWTGQALAVEAQLEPQPPGKLPPAALGYYTQATNVLHLDLLPAAKQLLDVSRARLDQAYSAQRTTEIVGIVVTGLLGVLLIGLLLAAQAWLARRFRRRFNPAMLVGTLITLALMVTAGAVFVVEGQRLGAARSERLEPYLELSQARAISYDAAADTSRYLISGNLAYYQQDFTAKSKCLVNGGDCGTDALPAGLADGWIAYQRDHQRIVGLADSGQAAAAVDTLTGIRRGDAAFDFFSFDSAVGRIADDHKRNFDASMEDAQGLLTGWVVIPIVAMGLVIVLILLGVRGRLAEYR
jgi:hypothetical protein